MKGSLWGLWLYDVCEEIDLNRLRTILGIEVRREPTFRHPSPEYVRFERPPSCSNSTPLSLKAAAVCGAN
jgi:hypothetical protein